jgi:hypothetical protein
MDDQTTKIDGAFTFWLSFFYENKFLGVAVVDLTPDDIGEGCNPTAAAITKAWKLGINPGGHVKITELFETEIPASDRNRLLNREEAEEMKSL